MKEEKSKQRPETVSETIFMSNNIIIAVIHN